MFIFKKMITEIIVTINNKVLKLKYGRSVLFSPIIKEKDRRAIFLIKRFNASGFFRMRVGNAKQEINLTWPYISL